jgi:hypothetical protein
MLRRTSLAAASTAVLLLAILASSPPAYAAPSPSPDRSCAVAPPDTARLGTALTPDGGPAYARWLEVDANRRANLAIQQATHATFGITDDKVSVVDIVRRGIIGSTADHNTQTVVVVVTPEYRAQAGTLEGQLIDARASVSLASLKVMVKVGCYSAERLAAAGDLLRGRSWHPDAVQASFGYWLDAADSRFHISFDPRYPEAAAALREQLGGVAVVTLDGGDRTGRLDDGRPHYGGAGVGVGTNNNDCTTGFVVRRNSDGLRGGVSAGHCFNNGQGIYSSTKYWGNAWGEYGYPTWDMIGVAAASETYQNRIHVDPCCPTTRWVTAKRNPVDNDVVCLSGMVTRAICGIRVIDDNGEACHVEGCTPGVMVGERNGDVIIRGGDSGGPVYIRSGSQNAIVLGVIICCQNIFTGTGTTVYAEKVGTVEAHLGVTVVTS